jgi:putative ABC transport system permease protein
MFSVVHGVLLRPLPFPEPQQLVEVQSLIRRTNEAGGTSYPDFLDWRRQADVFREMAVYGRRNFALAGTDGAVRLRGAMVSAGIFRLLGVSPEMGRWFTPEDEKPGAAAGKEAVILSHGLWRQRFGADRAIVGRTIELDHAGYTVVGVMPAGFAFPIEEIPMDVWVTVAVDARGRKAEDSMLAQRGIHFLETIARLRPDVTVAHAQQQMSAVVDGLNRMYPEEARGVRVLSQHEAIVGDVRTGLVVLMAAVGCVLLIACANLAGLLVARATTRRREMVIRAALGAGQRRIWQQLAIENISLCLAGAVLGTGVARWAIPFLLHVAPRDVPRLNEITLDATALAFTAGTSVLVMLVLGLAPLTYASRLNLVNAVRSVGRTQPGDFAGSRLRSLLVSGQMALAIVLLVCAGLLLQSLGRLMRVQPGFNPDRVVTFRVDLPDTYSGKQQENFYVRLVGGLETLAGTQSASAVFAPPLSGRNFGVIFDIEGRSLPEADRPRSGFNLAQPNYFTTLAIPFLSGRDFTSRDDLESEPVTIVNEAFARRFFRTEAPVGKRIKPSVGNGYQEEPLRRIIGVVGNVRTGSLKADPQPELYVPLAQCPGLGSMTAVVRTGRDMASVVADARRQIALLDGSVPLVEVRTLEQVVSASVAQPRFTTVLLAAFAGVAVLLAAIGIYGLISYTVAQRKSEIGIRLALGARTADIVGTILARGARLVGVGVAAGLAGAIGSTRYLAAQLYGVGAGDPFTLAVAVTLLAAVALFACYIPARRALRADPLSVLRDE